MSFSSAHCLHTPAGKSTRDALALPATAIFMAAMCFVLAAGLFAASDAVAQTPNEPGRANDPAEPTTGAPTEFAAALPDTVSPPPFRIDLMETEPASFDELEKAPDDDEEPWPFRNKRRRRWRTERTFEVNLGSFLRYNRVEGLAASVALEHKLHRSTMLPGYRAGIAYAFAAGRGQYQLLIEQPILPRHKITVGATAYRRNEATFYGEEIISGGENSMSALMTHRDYRNWFETDGGRVWLGFYPSPFLSATVSVTSQRERSLDVEADWSVFRQTRRFRPNPEVAEGTYRAYGARIAYDTLPERRLDRSDFEHLHQLTWERSEESLDSDFDMWRVVLDSRTYLRLSPDQAIALRLVGGSGSNREGSLSPQRRFVIGGIGTLRGHDFQTVSGDRLALANLEYEFTIVEASRGVVFIDTGAAWDTGGLFDQRFGVDVGAGIRLGEDGMSLSLARNVNRSDSDVKVLIRFEDTF